MRPTRSLARALKGRVWSQKGMRAVLPLGGQAWLIGVLGGPGGGGGGGTIPPPVQYVIRDASLVLPVGAKAKPRGHKTEGQLGLHI